MARLLVGMAIRSSTSVFPFIELRTFFSVELLHVRATGRIRRKSTHFDPYYIYQNRIYLIEPIEVYRSPSNYTKLPSRVSTPPQPSVCGIKLRNNTEYLLGESRASSVNEDQGCYCQEIEKQVVRAYYAIPG
nr:unnamed protein product [Haemonchus contortus]